MEERNSYDLIVIGAGCAGASGAMYAARLNLKTAMIALQPGGLITTTDMVENWPGIKQISGPDLAQSLLEHAMSYNVPLINENVEEVTKAISMPSAGSQSGYIVKTATNIYRAKAVLFATGTEHRKLGAPGENEFANKGVSYCALCDAGFYKNKTVAVVGSGDSAVKEAILLAERCLKVYLFVRGDSIKAEAPNLSRLEELKKEGKIEVRLNTEVTEIWGSKSVEKVKLKNGDEVELNGIFIAIGHLPLSGLAGKLGVKLNEKGEIVINRNSETSLPGAYAAGDVADGLFKQAITGAAEGVTGAFQAYGYLNKTKVVFE